MAKRLKIADLRSFGNAAPEGPGFKGTINGYYVEVWEEPLRGQIGIGEDAISLSQSEAQELFDKYGAIAEFQTKQNRVTKESIDREDKKMSDEERKEKIFSSFI